MRPVIALTPSLDLTNGKTTMVAAYEHAIAQSGGIPLILSSEAGQAVDELLAMADGLLLTGGVDVSPLLYGEQPIPGLGEVCPPRDTLEIAFCQSALAKGMPVLGICRGIQLLNVAMGGTLWQDIPSQVNGCIKHAQNCKGVYPSHDVDILPDSRLAEILGSTRISTNSFHHEAVKQPAPGLRVVASAVDGITEAVEGTEGWVMGIQWHPEMMFPQDANAQAIFAAFVTACRRD